LSVIVRQQVAVAEHPEFVEQFLVVFQLVAEPG
jgi:hypothetical protein